jgi:hypothetical protein
LLADVARRLRWAAAIYAGCVVFGHFGRRLFFAATGSVDVAFHVLDLVGLALVAMGLAVYGLARSGRVSATRLLDIGLVFEVLGALGIALVPIADHLPQLPAVCLLTFPPSACGSWYSRWSFRIHHRGF